MNEYFPHLFEPIKIGKTTVKNRIFMPPISTNMADKGYVTDALVEHYSARAKGGVGLIVTEVTTVEPVYTYLPGDMSIYDDSYIPGWKKLVDAIDGLKSDLSDLVDKVSQLQVVMDTGELVGAISPEMDRSLGVAAMMKRRGNI